MSFLTLDRLTKRFGDFTAVEALSLEIERGEFVSLLGPSGCGKTTTLQMIAGLQEPSDGRIHLDGRDITDAKPNARGLGIVFQSYALFPHMTVFDNVSFGLEMRQLPKAERQPKVMRALQQVKLEALAQRFPKELSGGQRQRVALARALVIEPPLLLLDEPLSNLDAKLREEMQLELRVLQQDLGVTTILVTHDQGEALSMSDRVVVMNDGRAIQIDTPVGMYDHPADSFVSGFVGKTNLLEGRVESVQEGRADIRLGEELVSFPSNDLQPNSAVSVSLRPEKLAFGPADHAGGVSCEVLAAVFHGAQWLYQVTSPMGDLLVTEPNTGEPPYRRGEKVKVSWPETAARILSKER